MTKRGCHEFCPCYVPKRSLAWSWDLSKVVIRDVNVRGVLRLLPAGGIGISEAGPLGPASSLTSPAKGPPFTKGVPVHGIFLLTPFSN